MADILSFLNRHFASISNGINIKKIRLKILELLNKKNKKFLKDSCIKLALIINSKKFNNLIFLNYAPILEKFLYWCQQLIAESLGKKGKGFYNFKCA